MAKNTIRIVVNRAAVMHLLRGTEVREDLAGRGARIQQAAGGPEDFELAQMENRDRAVVFVRTASQDGRRAEAEDRALTRAIDAGR